MAQNFIQPKGSLNTQVDISNLQNQLAQMFASQQPQGQVTQNAIDPTRQTVNQLIQEKLLPVEMPKFTTIQDIFKAPKGEKLNTFGQYLNTPSGQNLIGGVLGLLSGGTFLGSPNDNYATYLQGDMNRRQAHAIQQMNEQNEILKALNSAYNQRDIADLNDKRARELAEQELNFKKEQNELDRGLRREQMAQQERLSRIIHGGGGGSSSGGTVTGQAAGLTPKQIEALNGLNAVQSQMNRFSSSFDKVRPTKLGALLAGAVASKGFGNEAESNFNAQKTLLFNKIARELGGEKGVLSDQDIKRIEASLPALSDSLPQKKAKMQAIYDLLEDRKSQYRTSVSSTTNADPLGLGL